MKFIKTFESYEVDSTCPSREEMISHLCACGYNEAECDEMSMDDLEMQYNACGGGMAYEAKKNRAKAKAKAKAKKKPGMPDFPDVDGDGDTDEPISKANRDKKAAQARKGKAEDKTGSQAQGKLSAAQKKLPPALQKAIAAKRK